MHLWLQVMVPTSRAAKVSAGDVLAIEGQLVKSPLDQQEVEFVAEKVTKLSACDDSYPLYNAHKMPLDAIRKFPHLQTRTSYFHNMLQLRHSAEFAFHDFYRKHHFVKVNTPIITSNDCEGAGECFTVSTEKVKVTENEAESVPKVPEYESFHCF